MTALAPLECRHPRLGQSLWRLGVMRPQCLHARAAPAGVPVIRWVGVVAWHHRSPFDEVRAVRPARTDIHGSQACRLCGVLRLARAGCCTGMWVYEGVGVRGCGCGWMRMRHDAGAGAPARVQIPRSTFD